MGDLGGLKQVKRLSRGGAMARGWRAACNSMVKVMEGTGGKMGGSGRIADGRGVEGEGSELARRVARAVLDQYAGLPRNGKPGPGEWTILAGIVASRETEGGGELELAVVSLGTGSKCLGPSKMKQGGRLINDSHGEVLARRGLVSLLLDELKQLLPVGEAAGRNHAAEGGDDCSQQPDGGSFLLEVPVGEKRGVLKRGVSLHMYTSQAPCGDASIFSIAPHQGKEGGKGTGTGTGAGTGTGPGPGVGEDPPSKRFKVSTDDKKIVELKDDTVRTGAKPANVRREEDDGARQALGVTRIKPGRGERTRC